MHIYIEGNIRYLSMISILISNKTNTDISMKVHTTYSNYHIMNKDDEYMWSNENYADNAVIDNLRKITCRMMRKNYITDKMCRLSYCNAFILQYINSQRRYQNV